MAQIEKKPDINVRGRIDPAKIHSLVEIDDDAALQLVVQDSETTDAWIDAKRWTLRWRESDTLYQPPVGVQVWENTTVPRANVIRFTVATHVNSILPKLISGLFYEDPPFVLRPYPGTSQNDIRAIGFVQSEQLDEMDFETEVRRGFFQALIFGTGIWKWGWHQETKTERVYERMTSPLTQTDLQGKVLHFPTKESDQVQYKLYTKTIDRPFFEAKDIRHILVDPACRVSDIRKASFVIERMYLNYYDLEKLADQVYYDDVGNKYQRYDLPSRDEVKSWFEPPVEMPNVPNTAEQANQNTTLIHHAAPRYQRTCADPLMEPLEVLERWDCGKVLTVLQKDRLIRKEPNEWGVIPFNSVNWWDIPDSFYGLGLGRTLGQDQRIQQGMVNALLDITSLAVNPTYLRNAGQSPPTQSIRQRIGGIYDVQGDVNTSFKLLESPKIDPAIFAEIQQSEARAESTSGANEQLVQGNLPAQGRTSLGRTATGAQGMISASDSRIGGFIENFVRQVYEPWLYQMHDLNCQRLPLGTMREILKGIKDTAFNAEAFEPTSYLNARFKFDVLAGSHLAAKQQMAQSMVMLIQLFENPPLMQQLQLQRKKVNIEELLHMLHDMSGFKNYYDIIQPMTPADVQAMQQQNPAVIGAQAKAAQSNQEFAHRQALIDQENEARAARDILRMQIEKAERGETVEGVPGGTGFGSAMAG